MLSGIYAIRNTINGKVYVGSAGNIARRLVHHRSFISRGKHANQKLQRAWAKYGAEAFEFVTLEAVEIPLLAEREQYWIDTLNAVATGYNIRLDATNNSGLTHSAETRARMSAAHLGRIHADDTKARISAAKKGRPIWTDDQRARMKADRAGRRHTPEAIAKIAEASTGRKRSADSIARGEAKRIATITACPVKHTDQARANMSASKAGNPAKNRKPVVLLGIAYPSIGHAASAHGRTPTWVKARLTT